MDNHLRVLRKKRRLSQVALSIETGIDQALLSKYETGSRVPPTETLLLLADYYKVSIDYILNRTDNPEVNK